MARTNSDWKGRSYLSWSNIEHDVASLARKVQSTGFEFDKIATVSRGGLIPARLMADHFDIKIILVDKLSIPSETLFVDDIYDTGKTFKKIVSHFPSNNNFVYATLMARIGKKYPKQLVYARKTRGREYVVFPWEEKESERQTKLQSRKSMKRP